MLDFIPTGRQLGKNQRFSFFDEKETDPILDWNKLEIPLLFLQTSLTTEISHRRTGT